MVGLVIARLLGFDIRDHGLVDAALAVWFAAACVYAACIAFAWLADRKRGL